SSGERTSYQGAIDAAGINRQKAHRWRQLAGIPIDQFIKFIACARAPERVVTATWLRDQHTAWRQAIADRGPVLFDNLYPGADDSRAIQGNPPIRQLILGVGDDDKNRLLQEIRELRPIVGGTTTVETLLAV